VCGLPQLRIHGRKQVVQNTANPEYGQDFQKQQQEDVVTTPPNTKRSDMDGLIFYLVRRRKCEAFFNHEKTVVLLSTSGPDLTTKCAGSQVHFQGAHENFPPSS
jgi:hypothetical protein